MAELLPFRIKPCGTTDGLCVQPADFRGPFRSRILHLLCKLVEAPAPAIHEFLVVKLLGDDHVQEGHGKRSVGARTNLQKVFGACRPPCQAWIDIDYLGAELDAVRQPVAQKAIAIGGDGLVAPNNQYLGGRQSGLA